jgi:hypothetical protein
MINTNILYTIVNNVRIIICYDILSLGGAYHGNDGKEKDKNE